MKKFLFIAICWMIFSGCAKDVNTPVSVSEDSKTTDKSSTLTLAYPVPQREVAIVEYVADLGWVLNAGMNKVQVPENLSKEFQKQGLQVMVVFTPIEKGLDGPNRSGITYIHIIRIAVLSPTDK